MAKESINFLVASEVIEPGIGNVRRNSTGKSISNSGKEDLPRRRASIGSFCDGDISRRNSIGKPRSPNNGRTVLPHYLRASTGSCHDFCKYGKQHAFELKGRHPFRNRVIKPPSGRQTPIESGDPAEKKKSAAVKPKPSTLFKSLSTESPEIIKREVSSPSKKVEGFQKYASSHEVKIMQSEKKLNLSVKIAPPVKANPGMVKPLSSSDTLGGLNGRRNCKIEIGKKMGTSKVAAKEVPVPKTASFTPKHSAKKAVSLNSRKFRSLKLVSPLKDQNRVRKVEPQQPNNDKVQEKTLHVVTADTENKILESAQSDGTIELIPSPLPSVTKSLSSHPNSPSPSSISSSISFDEEDLEDSEQLDSETDYSISEINETVDLDKIKTLEVIHKSLPRKDGAVLSDDKGCRPMKLHFRRGRVVDLHSESNCSMRLRFRKGRISGENQDAKSDAQRRNFGKKGVDGDRNDASPGSAIVVLRHQDMEGKKDEKGLFNNVIEETASKLVESRKSKVKALVGAFETVISLQERKPSRHAVN